jgi:hypothetical protein
MAFALPPKHFIAIDGDIRRTKAPIFVPQLGRYSQVVGYFE